MTDARFGKIRLYWFLTGEIYVQLKSQAEGKKKWLSDGQKKQRDKKKMQHRIILNKVNNNYNKNVKQ